MILWKGYKPRFKSIIISFTFTIICMIILGLIPSGIFWAIYLTATILGITMTFMNTQFYSVLQTVIPKEIQGRIFSTTIGLIKVLLPIALIALGFLAENIGLSIVFIASPIIAVIITFIFLLTTPVLELDKIHFKEIDKEESNETVHS
ncbi:MAG: MFS transporter [Promethearchaeota archaeon]